MHLPLVHLIAGARPNFMKIAPLYHQLKNTDWCRVEIIHTGQHYDENMSQTFFNDFGLPKPDHYLGVGSSSHANQTAAVMVGYEKLCNANNPSWIVVVGDVNSTLACSIVGAKLCIPVAHLEAGLRSFDRTMPEEINRLVTDTLADLLWTPSPDADKNLRKEGVAEEKIERVGNIMIDSFEMLREKIEVGSAWMRMGLDAGEYGVVTFHRPANVDSPDSLRAILNELVTLSESLPLVFPVHPRTYQRITDFELTQLLGNAPAIRVIEPLGYIEFISLVASASLLVTDSGGIQEETTYLDIPCITVRDNTERPITITEGTNRLAKPHEIGGLAEQALSGNWPTGTRPEFWDGHTAERIAASLKRRIVDKN
ncbi:MAG: UDP-N-acetylglucosamine 2-epimerase (non-hydrolyzing) [Alphaproteobacteria bacterium]